MGAINLAAKIRKCFPSRILELAYELGDAADQAGLGLVVVGGGIRDLLLEWPFEEADFMIDHPAAPVVSSFALRHKARVVTHDRFKTFTVNFEDGLKIDITTARKERYDGPARLPQVETGPFIKITDDLMRRDFSINTLAVWVNRDRFGELLDPFNGTQDLYRREIRALHDQSFIDDPTRIFRAARFSARYDFMIEPQTMVWIQQSIKGHFPSLLSPVRLRNEFELILKERDPKPALKTLCLWNALQYFHHDWALNEAQIDLMSFSDLPYEKRLVQWFFPFGKDRALAMMSQLAFEKSDKKIVKNAFV